MKGKVVVSAVSIILVVGVVIGVVAGVHKYGSAKNQENLTPEMKSVSSICSPTVHKDLCMQSLSKTATNGTTDPKQLIQAAVLAALNSLKGSMTFTSALNSTEPRVQMAIDDCKEMFDYAVDELQAALSFVGESDLHAVNDRVAELQSWLSTVLAYHTSCMLGFEENKEQDDFKAEMEKNLQDPRELTGNVLMILDQISSILSAFNIKLDYKPPNNSRRLLSSDGYPTWLSAADRKLLTKIDIGKVVPNAVVAKDGSGKFRTINDALKAYPKGLKGRYIIYVKAGVYNEYVTVDKNMPNVFMYGDGPRKTIVTGNKSNKGGFSTWQTASFSAIGYGFLCKSMGFQNTAGPSGHQAVAVRVQSENAAFFNCRFDGFQDTLYVQSGRQFFRNCVISGTVDFIFGASQCLIQNSLIIARLGDRGQQNTITAQGGEELGHKTAIVIQNCRIVPDQKLAPVKLQVKSYLGRPWKKYATTVFMENLIGDLIQPAGYMSWNGDNTGYFAEYNNRGPGANVRGRVRWQGFKGLISRQEALKWTATSPFIDANLWLRATGVPFTPGLRY